MTAQQWRERQQRLQWRAGLRTAFLAASAVLVVLALASTGAFIGVMFSLIPPTALGWVQRHGQLSLVALLALVAVTMGLLLAHGCLGRRLQQGPTTRR